MKTENLVKVFDLAQLFLKAHNLEIGIQDMKNEQIRINDCLAINGQLFLVKDSYGENDFDGTLMYGCAMHEAREFIDVYLVAPLLHRMEKDGFVELLRWNKTIWAVRVTTHNTLEFVTWKDYHRQSDYAHGHYFGSRYKESKQDFIVRSGLI